MQDIIKNLNPNMIIRIVIHKLEEVKEIGVSGGTLSDRSDTEEL